MTSSGARPGSTLVRQKVMPPGLPSAVIARPRLDDLYTRLLCEHDALAVFAAAGSGKTVQTQQFAIREEWPLAWLTFDSADRSPSRVLSYLAAALLPTVDGIHEVLVEGFASNRLPDEVAALLAESVPADRLLVVFDQCEFIAGSEASCSAVQAFIEHLPRGVRTILLSRDEMNLSLGRLLLHGRVGRITDEDLAVTLDEAVLLARARGEDESNVSSRLEAARGWIAGVAFGASHHPGGHDNARDLDAYLAREIVQMLPADERRFLLDSSVLDGVSLRAAQALCGADSGPLWRKVGIRHLPATTAADGTIIYHPLFRRFLREQLEIEDPDRLRCPRARARDLLGRNAALRRSCRTVPVARAARSEQPPRRNAAAARFWHGVTTTRRCGGSTRSETSASMRAHCSSGPRSRHCAALDDSTRLGRLLAGCMRPDASTRSSMPTTGSSPMWRGPCCGSRGKDSISSSATQPVRAHSGCATCWKPRRVSARLPPRDASSRATPTD